MTGPRPSPLVLASSSPRRVDLLNEAGYSFEVMPAEVEEAHDEHAPVAELTRANAALKAAWVAERRPDAAVVVGADTLVTVDGAALGKPADMAEARRMLARLTGRTHEVFTAVCLIRGSERREFTVITRVTFRPLDSAGIDQYLTLINPLDKAGSYAAQEHGDVIIQSIDGSLTNVVGLPMERLAEELAAMDGAAPVKG